MKRIISMLLAAVMCFSMMNIVFAAEFDFTDVKTSDWFYNDVKSAVEMGLVNGKSATIYAPNDNLTYAEAIKLAACMNMLYTQGEITIGTGTPWYKPYADYCVKYNIIDKEYDYDANVTRAGYMGIFAKALPEEGFGIINNVPDDSIPDVPSSKAYAPGVYKLYRAGILTGVDEAHNCDPLANITRAEVAAILSRMMKEGKRVEFDMGGSLSNEGTIDINKPEEPDTSDSENKTEKVEIEPVEEPKDDPFIEDAEVKTEHESVVITPGISETPKEEIEVDNNDYIISELTIYKQPEGSDSEEYGSKYELEVQVYGGKAPYTYEWQYNSFRNQKTKIENGDYAKGADSATLMLSIEKENILLGAAISCKITDSEGTAVTTNAVKVYGPFSMPVDDWTLESGKNTLIGRVADGILKKGEKVSVIRDGKVIAIGVAYDLQIFNKSMDETIKGDNVGIVFNKETGVLPSKGDIVVKYQPTHVIDTSDIVN